MGCWYRWYKGKYLINKENITFHFADFSYSSNLTSTGLYIDFKIKFLTIFTFKNSRLLVKYFDIRNVQIISHQVSFSYYFYILFNCTNVLHLSTNPAICSHFPWCNNVASGHRRKCLFQTILMTNYYKRFGMSNLRWLWKRNCIDIGREVLVHWTDTLIWS